MLKTRCANRWLEKHKPRLSTPRQLALRFRHRLTLILKLIQISRLRARLRTRCANKWPEKLKLRLSTPRQLALLFRHRLLKEALWQNKWLDKHRLRLSTPRQPVLRLRPRLIPLRPLRTPPLPSLIDSGKSR